MSNFPRWCGGILVVALLVFFLAGCAAPSTGPAPAAPKPARNAFVLLSGGGTPLSNEYSQYLQARAIATALDHTRPAESTWFFFGLGNRAGTPPVLADVHRETNRDGIVVPSWLPGVLPRNRPATKAEFLGALRQEVLPAVRDGGTLFLFVGDHGELIGKGEQRESAITMWQLKQKGRRGGWATEDSEVLGVVELRKVLAAGLGQGRVVFCMTQCHSGGFHELAVPREMMPPAGWFARVPDWVKTPAAGVRLRIAGFTATDTASMAAGCDPDPDPEHWAGYERFFPEALWGVDLMTGRSKGQPISSLAAAHEAAVLIDQTIDKPRATSEHALDAWARLIETRLATSLALTLETQHAVAAYQRAVEVGRVNATDPEFQARQAQYARFVARLGEQLPAARALLLGGTRRDLETAIRGRGEGRGGGGRRGAAGEARRAWTETLRPAWKAAVLAGTVDGLTGAALEFERHLLRQEDQGRNFMLGRGDVDALGNEVYWESTYAEPARLDRTRAEAVARWGVERRSRIVAWGARAADAAVRAAAEKMGAGSVAAEPPRGLSRRTAAERTLFYRRILAAWEFLLTMQARPALAELQELIELERTSLPPVGP